MSARIRARHETCNKRLKTFNYLTPGFRHDIEEKHGLCFHAVANIVQMDILCGRRLFIYNDLCIVRSKTFIKIDVTRNIFYFIKKLNNKYVSQLNQY